MLEGIHILNKTMIMDLAFNLKLMAVFGILLVIFFVGFAITDSRRHCRLVVIFGLAFIACGFALLITLYDRKEVPTDRYRYEVTVGPYVRFTDIYERYDVVERRGEIWVLEDKEVNE